MLSLGATLLFMEANKQTLETWNKIASLYQDKFMDLDLYNETYDHVCESLIPLHAKILDVGCGPGNITRYFLSRRPDFDIHGIDTAPNMIQLAKQNCPTANFSVLDCRRISELPTKYDAIICGFCLPYLSQPETEKLIIDASILLNDNGLIYLSFVEGDPDNSGFQTGSSGDRVYFWYHSIDEIKAELVIHDFVEPRIFKVDYTRSKSEIETHTILTARRKIKS